MSEKDQQEVLLMAIEYLKAQYESLQNPCIALLISRYYRLLTNFKWLKAKSARQDFSRKLKWIRPILAAKNNQAIHACGGPRSSSVRHDTPLRVATRCAMTPVMT